MVELKFGPRTVDLPYTVHIQDVTEAQFDELVDEDTRAELIDGVMIVHSPSSPRHDDVAGFLRFLMRGYATRKRLGRVLGPDSLVRLKSGRKVGPDLFYFKQARLPKRLPTKQFQGAPDLIGEVLSPSNRSDDLDVKRPAYHQAGVEEIWLVDSDADEILVDRRRKKGYSTQTVTTGRLESTALEGFWIEVDWLWADELPEDFACLLTILGE
jgi:Uma2 family endonuclease